MVRRLGLPESMSFEDVDPGSPPDHLVRIHVQAAAVNFFDSLQIAGSYQVKPDLPFVPGAEVAGVVLAAPPSSGLTAGQRVLAQVGQEGLTHGGYTQVTLAEPSRVVAIPDGMPFPEAAAFFVNYQTGWFGLHRRAGLQPGEVLLVHAGAGGVGSAAIQLGKAAGARVIATAGSEPKVEVCRQMGADLVIDYSSQDFVDAVNEATQGRGADVIYDPVGGDVFDRSTKCIAFEGRLVVVGFTSGRIPKARANHALVKNYSMVGLHCGLYSLRRPDLVAECTDELFRLYHDGGIRPHVSRTFPLDAAPAAVSAVAGRQTTGKVVLLPDRAAG